MMHYSTVCLVALLFNSFSGHSTIPIREFIERPCIVWDLLNCWHALASVLHMYKTIYALFRMQTCRKDGPFYHCLFSALANFNVERQAYHGNTVVGNHVHKMLKVTKLRCCNIPFQPTSIDASCRHIEEVGERTGTTEAKDITVKFKMNFRDYHYHPTSRLVISTPSLWVRCKLYPSP